MKKKDNIKKEVLDIFYKVFLVKKKNYVYDNTKEWDSLAHMNLITKLEKKFNLKINEMDMAKFTSSDLIYKFRKKNKKK